MLKMTTLVLAVGLALPAFAAADLQSALIGAEATDATLASARANRDAGAENVDIARGKLLPQLSFQATSQYLQQTTVSSFGPSDFNGPSRSRQLNLRQAVFRPRDWAGLTIGQLQADYGEYKLASARADLWSRTVGAWIDVLAAKALRDTNAAAVASAQAAAEQERKRYAGGDGTRDAAAEAASQLLQAKAQLLDADLSLGAKRQAFKVLTRLDGSELDNARLPDISRLTVFPATEEDALARAVDTNPDLMAARAAEMINERRIAQAKADHMPTLDVVGSMTKAENDSTNTLGTSYSNHQVGFQLSVPLFSGGSLDAAQRQAAATYVASTADREAVEQRLRTQLDADWNTVAGLRERIKASHEMVAAAREQRRGADLGLKAGTKTWGDVSAADQLIARRESDLLNMIASMIKFQARILSLLPVTDPAWDAWTRELTALSQP